MNESARIKLASYMGLLINSLCLVGPVVLPYGWPTYGYRLSGTIAAKGIQSMFVAIFGRYNIETPHVIAAMALWFMLLVGSVIFSWRWRQVVGSSILNLLSQAHKRI